MSFIESCDANDRMVLGVKVSVEKGGHIPVYGSPGAAGADLFAKLPHPINIEPGGRVLVPTGVRMEIPDGYVGFIRPRSGMALKTGVEAFGGTIDSDYRGDIGVLLRNLGQQIAYIRPQQRIAQIVIMPFVEALFFRVHSLDNTDRGDGGFGSTGA